MPKRKGDGIIYKKGRGLLESSNKDLPKHLNTIPYIILYPNETQPSLLQDWSQGNI